MKLQATLQKENSPIFEFTPKEETEIKVISNYCFPRLTQICKFQFTKRNEFLRKQV